MRAVGFPEFTRFSAAITHRGHNFHESAALTKRELLAHSKRIVDDVFSRHLDTAQAFIPSPFKSQIIVNTGQVGLYDTVTSG